MTCLANENGAAKAGLLKSWRCGGGSLSLGQREGLGFVAKSVVEAGHDTRDERRLRARRRRNYGQGGMTLYSTYVSARKEDETFGHGGNSPWHRSEM